MLEFSFSFFACPDEPRSLLLLFLLKSPLSLMETSCACPSFYPRLKHVLNPSLYLNAYVSSCKKKIVVDLFNEEIIMTRWENFETIALLSGANIALNFHCVISVTFLGKCLALKKIQLAICTRGIRNVVFQVVERLSWLELIRLARLENHAAEYLIKRCST